MNILLAKFSWTYEYLMVPLFGSLLVSIASEGDLRRAITFLQSIANLKAEEGATIEDIHEITGVRFDYY